MQFSALTIFTCIVGSPHPHCRRGTKSRRNRSWHVLSGLEDFPALERATESGS